MSALPQDLRYAFRALRKAPLFSAVAILSLAFGIGANTAIFTLIHQLILRHLPVENPQQLAMLAGRGRHYGGNNGRDKLSYPMYQDIRDKNQVFAGMFCTHTSTMSASIEGRTELVSGELVSGNFFRVLGIGAAIGRVFTGSDDLYQGGHPLAVLSYGYWKTRFGGDRGILGKKIVVNGYPLTVIGVSQAGFDGVEPGYAPQMRVPMQSTRPRLADTLKDQANAVLHGGSVQFRRGLVVTQVALSLLLLIGAGLFLRSLRNLKYTNPGFDVRGLLSFAVEPTLNRYDKPWTFDYYRRLRDRLKAMPGIEAETLAMIPVLQDDEWDNWVTIEGYTPKQGETPDPHTQYCSTDYFVALKIPIVLGRDFTIKDAVGAPKVGIVNQKLAHRYFGGANPLGRHLGMGIDPGTKMDIEIVGVAGDTKYENMSEEIPYELYIPYTQLDFVNGMTVYLRAHGDPTNTFNTLRRVVREVDPAVPMYDLRTLDDQIEITLFIQRLLATLSTAFGGVSTLLAALGLYGVMAFMVVRRTREIGIRMALGADTGSVIWMVMREVLLLAAIGVVLGVGAAWAATRLIQAQLFGIQATDLATMAAAALGIVAVAALSGYFPARRATTIDPVRALRWE